MPKIKEKKHFKTRYLLNKNWKKRKKRKEKKLIGIKVFNVIYNKIIIGTQFYIFIKNKIKF
jgi:hypothetical protein